MDYLRLIKCSVTQWNQWRLKHPNRLPDLSGADLSQTFLFEANLSGINLSGANLSRACLIGADLSRANLSRANLSRAYLSEATLSGANLSCADLSEVQVTDVDFEGANLAGTYLALDVHNPSDSPSPVAEEISRLEAVYQSTGQRQNEAEASVPLTVLNQPTRLAETAYLNQSAQPENGLDRDSGNTPVVWNQELLEQCQQKLSDYYISPIAALILDDIVTLYRPPTFDQFIDLVASYIPDRQDALCFRNGILPNAPEASNHPCAMTLNDSFIEKCQQELTEYYIAPIAQMIVDETMALHHPTSPHQLVKLIADQLPPPEAESFSRQAQR